MSLPKVHPCHIGLLVIALLCILCGFLVARAGAEENPTWQLLRGELSGREPDKVSVENLAAAMSMAMLNHPEQAMPLFTTCIIIACNSKPYPKRATVFILYTATYTMPDIADDFVDMARQICSESGAHKKVVLPKKETVEEDLGTPFNFSGLTPPTVFTPITPVTER